MAVYVDYTYYISNYFGTAVAEADFPRLARVASKQIDRLTFGRAAPIVEAATETDTIDAIKMATCAVAEQMQTTEEGQGQIQSEKVGQHSVTYVTTPTAALSEDDKIERAARLYLWDTNLMYKGFLSGEYAGTVDAD